MSSTDVPSTDVRPLRDRVDRLDWDELTERIHADGFAVTEPLLAEEECDELLELFEAGSFRSTVEMARHRFGEGSYRYFDPLPAPIAALREGFYRHLSPIANEWAARLRTGDEFPADLAGLLERCHAAGQTRPTPLILRYGEGGWNALHQDLYGDVYFPFQVLTVLSRPGIDFEGGEFVLVEQRPRAQSRAHVLDPPRGGFVIFPTNHRPNRGRNGYHRVVLRHGVSTLRRGSRTALGIIFHDAK